MDIIFAIRKKLLTTKVIRLLFKWEAELPVSRLISSFGLAFKTAFKKSDVNILRLTPHLFKG